MTGERKLPRKVLHVMNSAGGGAALSVLGLIETMRREGVEACAVCHDAGTAEERASLMEATGGETLFTHLYWWNRKTRAAAWKRPLIEARQAWRTGRGRISARRVRDFAAHHGAELIHTNTILTPEGGIAARQLGVPHVWHLRELLGPGRPFRLRLEGPALGRYLARHCSKLIANSEMTASLVREWLPPGLLAVVPNGIDLSRFTVRDDERRDAQPVVVGMVANLTSRVKKHWLMIEAAARVDRSLAVEFRIYGHDPSQGGERRGDAYVDDLHARIRHHDLAGRFRWPGFVADPARVMSEIDLLIHPTDDESFGRVVVEAMAAGLPVVGVRGGGVGEIIEDGATGLLAEPDQPEQLAACVERLVKDRTLRRTLGLNGRRRAETSYSLENCARRTLAVYEAAMERQSCEQRSGTVRLASESKA